MTGRILWLTKGLGRGGAERLLTLSASRMDKQQFSVEVAYLLPWKDAFVPEIESAGVPVHCLEASGNADLGWVPRLRSMLKNGGFDLVHTHSPVPAVAARLLAASRVRLVHTEHNVWDRYRWLTTVANAATFGRNDAVIAVSEGVAASIRTPRWMPWVKIPRVYTLHHGIDAADAPRGPVARAEARAELDIDDDRPVIGTVGNFTPKKNHAGLVKAVQLLVEQRRDLLLVLVGDGPLEDEVRAQVQSLGLADNVRFLGSRGDVPDLLPGLDVFVLASRYEGLAIALLEALAAGVPCVATAVGGIPEAVRHEQDGLLVPPDDPRALADAVGRLLDDPDLRHQFGESGATQVAEHFSVRRATREIESIYEAILSSVSGTEAESSSA